MFLWAQLDAADDVWIIAEGQCDEDCGETKKLIEEIEESYRLHTAAYLMDPNMGRSPASTIRGVTWQDEFSDAGLSCELADDSDVGRGRINEFLKPDPHTRRPRLHIHERCVETISQMKRYTWDEHKRATEKDLKQKPRPKYDDFPTCLKYLMNYNPRFSWLKDGAPIIRRAATRKGAYG
jgi:hypothetical protein